MKETPKFIPPEVPDFDAIHEQRTKRIELIIKKQAELLERQRKQEHLRHLMESFIIAVAASVLSAIIVKFLL